MKKLTIDYEKYKGELKYVSCIVYNFYKKQRDLFKSISMDLEDLQQEVYLEILQILQRYEDGKIEKNTKLLAYLKQCTINIIEKTLRENEVNILINFDILKTNETPELIEGIIEKRIKKEKREISKEKNKNKERENKQKRKEKRNKIKHNIDNIYLEPNKDLKNEEIIKLLKRYCIKDIEFKIAKLKIIDGLKSYKEISKVVGVTRQRAGRLFRNLIRRMKKDIDNLSDIYNI